MPRLPRSVLILAGGRSRRMGRDKRLISVGNRRCALAAQVDVLRTLDAPIWLATAPHDSARPRLEGVAVLWDRQAYRGPLAAIVDASGVLDGEIFVVAADLPQLRPEFLWQLDEVARRHSTAWAVIPCDERGWQPLCGWYRDAALRALARARDAGVRSVTGVLASLEPGSLCLMDARGEPSLYNWNRPVDRQDPAASGLGEGKGPGA